LLGENLVLFRDEQGCYGLIDRHCAHRGADLAFGRLENGGLRCAFHGWLFDVAGKCLETPAEPKDSPLCKNITQRAYPVIEKSGILWAYLGEGAPPAFPEIDCFVAPDAYTFAFKGHINCNWLGHSRSASSGARPFHHRFRGRDTSALQALRRVYGHRHADDKIFARIRPARSSMSSTEYGLYWSRCANRRRAPMCLATNYSRMVLLSHEHGDDHHAVACPGR
jgi:phenylpropionate dioxygenase-like ring-hydroxylating dioxygenase large terminal subunit